MGFSIMLWGAEKLVPVEYWCPYGTSEFQICSLNHLPFLLILIFFSGVLLPISPSDGISGLDGINVCLLLNFRFLSIYQLS